MVQDLYTFPTAFFSFNNLISKAKMEVEDPRPAKRVNQPPASNAQKVSTKVYNHHRQQVVSCVLGETEELNTLYIGPFKGEVFKKMSEKELETASREFFKAKVSAINPPAHVPNVGIVDYRLVYPKKGKGKGKGKKERPAAFAYMDFESAAAAQVAQVALDNCIFCDREIRVQVSKPTKTLYEPDVVFLSNLPSDITDDQISAIFTSRDFPVHPRDIFFIFHVFPLQIHFVDKNFDFVFEVPIDVRIRGMDEMHVDDDKHVTGPRAYVQFEEVKNIEEIISNALELHGQKNVIPSHPETVLEVRRSIPMKPRSGAKVSQKTNRTLYISKLPDIAKESDLMAHCTSFHFEPTDILLKEKKNGGSFAFVEFIDHEFAMKAKHLLNHTTLFGQTLHVENSDRPITHKKENEKTAKKSVHEPRFQPRSRLQLDSTPCETGRESSSLHTAIDAAEDAADAEPVEKTNDDFRKLLGFGNMELSP